MENNETFKKNPGSLLTFLNGRNTVFPLPTQTATVTSFQAGVVPGGDVKRKLFLCLDDLPFCVKCRTNYPAQGVCVTDRKTAFSFQGRGNTTHE